MSTIANVGAPRLVRAQAAASGAECSTGQSTDNQGLLPKSNPPSQCESGDAMAQLYAMLSKANQNEMQNGAAKIEQNKKLQKAAVVEERAAIERAKKAAEEQKEASKGVMDWVTDDIGVAGVVGLCTFNYPLVIADVAVHKLGLVENLKIDVVDAACAFALQYGHPELLIADLVVRHPEILPGELHDKIASVASFSKCLDDKTLNPSLSDQDVKPYSKQILAANLVVASVAVTICSLGTATPLTTALAVAAIACSVAAYTAENVEPVHNLMEERLGAKTTGHVILGLHLASAALSVGSGVSAMASAAPKATTEAVTAMRVAKGASTIANGGLQVDQGIRTIRGANTQHDVDLAQIDMKAARNRMKQMERAVELVIDGLKDARDSGRRALESLQQAIEIRDQTPLQIAGAVKA